MIGAIVSLVTGGGVKAVAKLLTDAYASRADAKTEAERIAADERIATLEAQQAILLSEQQSWMTRWVRPAFAFPFVVYIWKLVLWDKVLGWGATDPLSDNLTQIMMLIIGAYFVGRSVEKVWKR
jgi:hypothetical protein